MHDLIIIVKGTLMFCIVWCMELFISTVMVISFIPVNVREFFEEIKTPLAVLTSFAIFILTVIRIIKENKKK